MTTQEDPSKHFFIWLSSYWNAQLRGSIRSFWQFWLTHSLSEISHIPCVKISGYQQQSEFSMFEQPASSLAMHYSITKYLYFFWNPNETNDTLFHFSNINNYLSFKNLIRTFHSWRKGETTTFMLHARTWKNLLKSSWKAFFHIIV